MSEVKLTYPKIARFVAHENSTIVVPRGLQSVSELRILPNSGTGTSSLQFSFQPPSTNTLMDRVLLLSCDVVLTCAADSNGSALGRIALESWPLNRMLKSINLSVNGTTITSTPYNFVTAFEKLGMSSEHLQRYHSLFPSQPSKSAHDYYQIARNTPIGGPFSKFTDGNHFNSISRYGFPHTDVGAEGATTALTRTWRVTEPLLINFAELVKECGIANINNVQVNLEFSSSDQAVSMVVSNPLTVSGSTITSTTGVGLAESYAYNAVLASSTVDMLPCSSSNGTNYGSSPVLSLARTNEQLLVRFVTVDMKIPQRIKLPYTQITQHMQNINQNLAKGNTITVNMNTIKTEQVPSMVYIFVRNDLFSAAKTSRVKDTFLPITQLSLMVNNENGILSGATQEQLFQISARNGYNHGWKEFSSGGGCVLCLKPGQDFKSLPTARSQWSLTISQAVVANPFQTAACATAGTPNLVTLTDVTFSNLQIHVILCMDGVLNITPSTMSTEMGYDISELNKAAQEPFHEDESDEEDQFHGGSFKSFWRKMKKKVIFPVYNYVKPGIKDVINTIVKPGIHELARDLGSAAHAAITGSGEDDMGGNNNLGGQVLGGAYNNLGGQALGGAQNLGGRIPVRAASRLLRD